jgi:dihydrodipicolinate synthase/N-acetylneuraminate lyase
MTQMRKTAAGSREKYALRGIVVSLNTPFDANDRIDFPALDRLVDYHLGQGAVGFLSPAQAGEVTELTLDERLLLVQRLREITQGRARFIAGATAAEERDSFVLAEAATGAGCDGVLVEAPAARKRDRGRMMEFFRSFARIGMPMLMIQDLEWGGPGLDVGLIVELFETLPAFRCLKVEVVPAGPKYTAVREATGGRLQLSGGWAAEQMIEALDRGVDAFIPTAMTGLYRRVFEAHGRGDLAAARQVFRDMLPVLAFTRQHLEIAIHFYKRLFHHRGLFATPRVRKRLIPYDRYHEACGQALIDYLDRLEEV